MRTNYTAEATAETADTQLVARLRVAVGRLSRQLRQQTPGGVTVTQLSALVSVERQGAIRLGELAAVEGIAPSTLSRIVAALENDGLVRRETDATDRRAYSLMLTDKGRELLASVRAEGTLLLARRYERLSPEDRETLVAALPALEQLTCDPETRRDC